MKGYVYLIGSPTFGWYKIGKSITPVIRVSNLGVLLPFKLVVIGVWKAENHTLLEQTLHDIYKDCRINGEWFEFAKGEVYKVFETLPKEACVYPVEGQRHPLNTFSNIEEDRKIKGKKPGKVLGLRVQNLRGDFTPEERDARRIASMAEKKLKKELKTTESLGQAI